MAREKSSGEVGEITADDQVAKIFEWRRGFNAMHLIDLGVRLGLFRAFAQTPDAKPSDVAQALRLVRACWPPAGTREVDSGCPMPSRLVGDPRPTS